MKFAIVAAFLTLAIGVAARPDGAVHFPARRGNQFVTGPCTTDDDCQQGCCAFTTGKCAGPDVAQTNGDGGCGFGNASPNCNVALALGLSGCVSGAVNGDISAPDIQAAAQFTANLDGLPFTPASAAAAPPPPPPPPADTDNSSSGSSPATLGTLTVFEQCTSDAACQQGCCGFSTGKCAGPDVAQTNGDGGCGFGDPAPNCNVASALGLDACVAGAVNGDLSSPLIQAQAQFVSQLDGLPFTPQ